MIPESPFREGLDELASHYKQVLTLLGEDPEREGLEKTPMRVAKAMQVLTRGYTQDPHKVLTDALFEEKYNQMVIVKDIDFFSMCEHHMLPFYGKAHVAYIPKRIYYWIEQDSTCCRYLFTPFTSAGTPNGTSDAVY